MISRINLALALLLAAQIALLGVIALTTGGSQSHAVEPIVKGMTATDIDSLTIASAPDDEITFARKDNGWVLPNADDFPVNGSQVNEALDKLLGMDSGRLVASNPVNFGRLAVKDDDYRRRVELRGGASSAVIYLGEDGGVDSVYTRRDNENEVYLGRGLNAWELSTQVAGWVDASYVNLAQDDLLSLHIDNAHGSLTLARDGETWTLADLAESEQFEDTRLPGVLRNAASIRLVEPLGRTAQDSHGMDAPRLTLTLTYRQPLPTEAGDEDEAEESAGEAEAVYSQETLSLTFGAALDDGHVVLKSSDNDYFVTVRESVYSAFSELRRADFVKAAESPSVAPNGLGD